MSPPIPRCVACGHVVGDVVWEEPPFVGRRCACGLICACPLPASQVDGLEEHHPDSYYSDPAAVRAKWVAAHCPRGDLLEIGCGQGHFLEAARKAGYRVAGIEPDAGRAAAAEHRLGIPIRRRFLHELDGSSERYDVVFHCDLLVHFPDPISALRQMSALLREDGVLCFEVGLLGGISTFWYRLIGRIGLGHHIWLYSRRALNELLTRSDMSVEACKVFGLAPAVFGSKARGLARRAARLVRLAPPPSTRRPTTDRWESFLRYRVGAISPRIGPQTVFLVARPLRRPG